MASIYVGRGDEQIVKNDFTGNHMPYLFSDIICQDNVVTIKALRHPRDVSDFYRIIWKLTQAQGYSDIFIDLSQTGTIFPNAATPFCAALDYYKKQGINFIIEGEADFVSSAGVCEPLSVENSKHSEFFAPLNKIWKFISAQDVFDLTKTLTDSIFSGLICEAGVIEGFEWCINEIMDNVLQHSQCGCGYVMAQAHKTINKIAVCVADSGIGLFSSLQSYKHPPLSHLDAITLSIKEGVTRDKEIGQGNGLWGLSSIVAENEGALTITSGRASLIYRDSKTTSFTKLPFLSRSNLGTVVDFQINPNKSIDMSKALKYTHVNLRLESFESPEGIYTVSVAENTHGTGTRKSGEMLRNKVLNIMIESKQGIKIDFSGIGMVSSSFADEFIAKLILHIGFVNFNRLIKIVGISEAVTGIVEKAIGQRMSQAFSS